MLVPAASNRSKTTEVNNKSILCDMTRPSEPSAKYNF